MTRISLAVGVVLWLGATALLLEDAWRSGHATAAHLMMPVLTSGTVLAAVLCHHRLASLRLLSGVGFLLLALLGSLATVYGTLGRQAEAHDTRSAAAVAANRTVRLRQEALAGARSSLSAAEAEVARECRGGFGKNCAGWRSTLAERQAEVRRTEAELSTMAAVPVDARMDAVVRLAMLLGANDEAWLRAVVAALDPVLLPLFLELGSILFFSAGFPAEPRETVRTDAETDSDHEETVRGPWSQDQALADLRAMTARNVYMDQRFLAARWGRSKGTVSRWMADWEADGVVVRSRDGKSKRPTTQ